VTARTPDNSSKRAARVPGEDRPSGLRSVGGDQQVERALGGAGCPRRGQELSMPDSRLGGVRQHAQDVSHRSRVLHPVPPPGRVGGEHGAVDKLGDGDSCDRDIVVGVVDVGWCRLASLDRDDDAGVEYQATCHERLTSARAASTASQ
jgi:hypothetical protein